MESEKSIQSIKKIFNEYQIELTSNMDYINILIQNRNTFNIYESKFNLEYLHQFKLLMGNLTIDEVIKFINDFIDGNDIKIEENEYNLNLNLISKFKVYPDVKLILNKNNLIEKLINEIEGIKNENKILKNNYEIIKNKIELIEEENKILNMRIDLIGKEKKNKININDKLGKENAQNEENKQLNIKKENINNEELYKKIELIEKNNKELNKKIEKENEIINEIKNKIKILEGYHKNKGKNQLTKCNLQNINSIQPHKDIITSVSTFPSGNIISVSLDKSIII